MCCICSRIFIVLYMYSSYVVIIHLNNFHQRKLTTQWLTDALQLKWTVRAAAVRRAALFCILATILIVVIVRVLNQYALWQYKLWSFKFGDTKVERFLPKNQLWQMKLLNFENWCNGELSKIGHHFSWLKIDAIKKFQ